MSASASIVSVQEFLRFSISVRLSQFFWLFSLFRSLNRTFGFGCIYGQANL